LKFKPDDAGFRCNLGGAFFLKGQVDDAIFQYKAALKSDPDNATAYYNLGNAMIQKGQMDEAMVEYENTLKFDPDNAAAHGNLGAALFLKGRVDEATSQYQEALKMQPDNILYQNNLARAIWQLVISGDSSSQNGGDILGLAQKANELAKGNNPVVLRILAAAEADNGDFPEAIEKGQEALSLALNRQDLGLSNILKEEIAVYQGGGCIRSNSPTSTLGWP
jgi:superkiller protein 3